jgi:hypothetical protein
MSDEDVKVAWIEIYGFIASKCFMVQRTAKDVSSITSRKDFIMQNCFVKQRLQARKILQCRTAL